MKIALKSFMNLKAFISLRSSSKNWRDGKFVHPPDACFDTDGNIFVAEWVATGRVSKMKRLGIEKKKD